MVFTPLPLAGAYRIELEKIGDDRGFFARYFCSREFEARGLQTQWVQINTTLTQKKGSIRGLHFQRTPKAEEKVVRCLRGAIFDVLVDLREGSPTFGKWLGVELNAQNRSMLYIPKGFAHGFQTLTNACELLYLHSEFYAPECEGGIRYDDPLLHIEWPLPVRSISQRDEMLPTLQDIKPILL